MRPGLDDQRRQAGQVGEDRADQAVRGVVSRGVVGDPGRECLRGEQRVGVAFGVHGRPGQGEVGIRGHGQRRGGQGQPVIAGADQGGDGEPAAGGLSRDDDVGGGGAAVQQGGVGGQGVVDRGRVGVLGGEPVVDGDDRGAGPRADLRGQPSGLEGVPDHIHPAVEIQHHMAGFDPVDGDLGGGDAAQDAGGHGHAGGQRLRRGILARQPPQLADVAVERQGGLPQDRVEVLALLGTHRRSPFDRGLAGLPGGPAQPIHC